MKKLLHTLAAAIIAAALSAIPAVASDNDDDVQEVTREKVKKMRDTTAPSVNDESFGDAFDPENAQKSEKDEDEEAKDKTEFVPINQITVIRREIKDTAATATAKKNVGNLNLIGLRGGFGSPALNIGGNMKLGFWEANRIDIGLNFGFLGGKSAAEMNAFYEWRFKLSDDGILGWYTGGGIVGGWYGGSYKEDEIDDTGEPTGAEITKKDSGFNAGIGGIIGLEVFLTFIDPEHSLYRLKDTSLSFDIRPIIYIGMVKGHGWGATAGISLRQRF